MSRKLKLFLFIFIILTTEIYCQYKHTYLELGRQELIKNNYPKAINFLNYSLQMRPDLHEAYFLRGLAKYYLDDYYGAEQDYSKAIEMFPPEKRYYVFRAIVRDMQYNIDGAFKDFEIAFSMDSAYNLAYYQRALTYLRLHEYEKALKDANNAISYKINENDIYLIRGIAYSGLEDYKNAIFDFNKVIINNPFKLNTYIHRAIALMNSSSIDSALTDLNFVINIDSTNSLAIYYRAMCKIKNNQLDEALKDLNKVIAIAPFNARAYYYKGIIYNKKEEGSRQAYLNFNKALSIDPDNILIYYARGLNQFQYGELRSALEDMNSIVSIYPDFVDAYYLRSSVKTKLNDYLGAKADHEKAMEISEKYNNITDSASYSKSIIELMKLTNFTGDFISMSEKRELIQYQERSINLKPFYKITLFPEKYEALYAYQPKRKKYYSIPYLSFIALEDSISIEEKNNLLKNPDSLFLDTNSTEFLIKKAIINYSAKNYLNALTILNQLIDEGINEVASRFTRANIMLELLELVQNNNENYKDLINTFFEEYSSQENFIAISFENVLTDYSKVIQMDTDFFIAYYNRAYLKYLIKDYNGAIDDFWQALKYNANFPEAYYNRGLILIFRGEKNLGCEDISKAGELGIPDSYNVLKKYCSQ